MWNTDLIETLELGNLLNQACQVMCGAENRHEFRGAQAHADYPDRIDVEWMQHTVTWVSGTEIEYGAVKFDYRSVCDQPKVEYRKIVWRMSCAFWQILCGRFSVADCVWQMLCGRFCVADLVRQMLCGRCCHNLLCVWKMFVADLAQGSRHGQGSLFLGQYFAKLAFSIAANIPGTIPPL